MDKLPQFVALAVPSTAGGMEVQQAMITAVSAMPSGAIDAAVHDGAGALGRADLTVFSPLQAPHPAAGVVLFDSFESAKAAIEAHAAAGVKFICAYIPKAFVSAEEWVATELAKVRRMTEGHADALTDATGHLGPTADHKPEQEETQQA
jgi:hypothetical protein